MYANTIKNKNIEVSLYLVIFVGVALIFAKIYFYTIHSDDPWFAEEAYWLAKDGFVRSEFFSSVLNYGVQQFAYHKLHIWIAALAIKIFGIAHIYLVLKSITLSFFCVFLFVAHRYFYEIYNEDAAARFLIFLAFILVNSIAIELVFVYRPEIAIMCLGFIEFFLINKSIKEEKGKYVLYSGIFAGLCVLMHLNGVIYVLAGFFILLINKKTKLSIWFCIVAVAISSFYFVDIFPHHWATYWMQFRHDPAIPSGQFSIRTLPERILLEYTRFFGHGYESGYSLLLLTVIIADYKFILEQVELRNSLIFFSVLALSLAAISPEKNHYYLLFGMPYIGVIVSGSLFRLFNQASVSIKKRVVLTISVLYVIANVPHALAIINDGTSWQQHHLIQINREVIHKFKIKQGDKVLAPLYFIFDSIKYEDIKGVDAYMMRARLGEAPLNPIDFFNKAASDNIKFILMFGEQMADLKVTPDRKKNYFGYAYLGSMFGYYVFERKTKYSLSRIINPISSEQPLITTLKN